MSRPSEHRTRLYLVSPPSEVINRHFYAQLEAALLGGDVAAFLLRTPQSGSFDTEAAEALVGAAQRQNVAALIENDLVLAKALKADGVHLTTGAAVRTARAALGEAIVGVYCGLSRHEAMLAGENGADYVAFGCGAGEDKRQPSCQGTAQEEIAEVVAWWSELMEPPVVVWLDDAFGDLAFARQLIQTGADFLAVGGLVWKHPEGPGAAVAALNALCAGATDEKTGTRHA